MQHGIDEDTSRIFNLLKVLSIFMVMVGHFFKEYDLLWLPVTVGMLIFSFSSGYFTSIKYKGNFSRKKFWRKKFERLGMSLLVVNVALFILFLIQGRPNIWTWHSLVNILGLNGFLNWLRIPNQSPFGAGMWFFTLLLIFYLSYPLMEKIEKNAMTIFMIFFIGVSFYLNLKVNYGHALWLTACGFVTGVWAEKNQFRIPPSVGRILSGIILVTMLLVNFKLNIKIFNFFFILAFSICAIYSCMDFKISEWLNKRILFCSACMLEIYLIHGYFFMTPTQNRAVDFILSLIVILMLSKILSIVSIKLNEKMIKAHP